MLHKNFSGFQRVLSNDGFYITGQRVSERLKMAWRSYFLGRRLRAPRAIFGHDARIIGARFIEMGENFSAGRGLWLEAISKYGMSTYVPKIVIGRNVSLSDHVHISSCNEILIGDNVLVGSGAFICDCQHGSYAGDEQSSPDTAPAARHLVSAGATRVGANVWIGENAVIMPGITIGIGAIIGANAVVTRDIDAWTIVAGVPAQPIKRYSMTTESWERL